MNYSEMLPLGGVDKFMVDLVLWLEAIMACTLSTLEIIHYITLHNIAKFNHFGASYSDGEAATKSETIFQLPKIARYTAV